MPKILCKSLWILLLLFVDSSVLANYERANSGIKTTSYRREPLNAPVYDQVQQQQQQQQQEPYQQPIAGHNFPYSHDYQTRNVDAYDERLSSNQNNLNNNKNSNNNQNRQYQQRQREQYEQGDDNDNQHEIPLYARNRQAQQIPTSAAENENAINEYYSTCPADYTGQLAYAYDCHRFLNCWHGRGHIQSCSAGTAFNPKTQQCDRSQQVDCSALGALAVIKQKQQAVNSNSNRNSNYRAERLQDVYAEPVQNVRCAPGVAGLQPHPSDCTQFLNCANGNAHIQKCGPGTAYSIPMMVCDYKHKVDCTGRNGNSEGSLDNTRTSSTDIMCLPNVSGNFPYPFDYTKFLNCKNGNTAIQNCNSGTAFSMTKGFCEFKDNVPSNQRVQYVVSDVDFEYSKFMINCPSGTNGLHLYPFDSAKYIQCSNGEMTILDCAPQAVFSVTRHMCLPKHQIVQDDYVRSMSDVAQQLTTPLAALGYNNRDPKSYENRGRTNNQLESANKPILNPYQGQLAPGVSNNRDRWSTMNMQRPMPENDSPTTWTGTGSSTTRQNPTQSVLHVEGSLHPDSIYGESTRTYSVPLAPMAPYSPSVIETTTANTKLYYAQPVGSREDSKETFNTNAQSNPFDPVFLRHPPYPSQPQQPINRQNLSREINHPTAQSNWHPIVHQNTYPSSPKPFQHGFEQNQQDNRKPATHFLAPHSTDQQGQVQQELDPFDDGQHALNTDYNPTKNQANLPIPSSRALLPSTLNQGRNQEYQPTQLAPFNNPNPNRPADDTNLFGGLQPPRQPSNPAVLTTTPTSVSDPNANKNVHVFQLYPPLSNASVQRNPLDPHYSSPYAGIAHSRNTTWPNDGLKGKQHSSPQPEFVFNNEGKLVPFQRNLNDGPITSTTERRDVSTSPYSRHYYESTTPIKHKADTEATEDNGNELPINDAIRMLLRPYFNRSGTVKESEAQQAESHIMKLVVPNPTIATTPSTTTPRQEDEVELIFAGEQNSLTNTPPKSTTTPRSTTEKPKWHVNDHNKDYNPNHPHWTLNQNGDVERASVDQNRNKPTHNREFHARHPNLPNPFDSDRRPKQTDTDMHHKHHHHQHQQHPLQHSREFHQKHPHIPNPFATREGDISIVEEDDYDIPNPNAESTTPVNDYIDLRFRKTEQICQFDCGNGKCINETQICDGVNNCGNRNDEANCDHLGYEVRLTGGESSNMGRVEVKISGKWGSVCDDSFGLLDADVVCKELGFKYGADEVRGNSYYPPNEHNASFAMDKVNCLGNETSLKLCDFSGWGVHNCGPEEVVGVVCKVEQLRCPKKYWLCSTSEECIPPEFVCDNTPDCADESDESDIICKTPVAYRLEGGRSEIEGRLEVKYRGKWGTVCNDDFGEKEAQVACNSLGYYGTSQIEKKRFGPGNGPIWLTYVSCAGNEDTLDKCSHWPWGEHNCNHTDDIGIRCSAGPTPRMALSKSAMLQGLNALDLKQSASDEADQTTNIESSSKFMEYQNRCGHFKPNLLDEFDHPVERIVKGNATKRGRHPWQAAIRLKGTSGQSTHSCGAVLISKKHLLTAAHCLAGYPKGAFFVRLGDHYTTVKESSEVDMFIKDWYIHDKFREAVHMNNDIALVVLKHAVQFNDYIQPICLPEKGATLQADRMCTVSGWGSIKSGSSTPSNSLRAAQLPIISEKTCKQPQVYGKSMTENMFCAGFMDGKTDACDGDSGGPLVCADKGGETLYGIISWGKHCGYVNKPGVYVQVEKYIDWIYSKINFSLRSSRS